MEEKKYKTRIQQKHDLEVNWLKAGRGEDSLGNSKNPFVPMSGEMIIYDAEADINGNLLTGANGNPVELPEGRTTPYNFERIKIGDGKTNVTDLPFAWYTQAQVQIITWEDDD